jgi:NADH dehydrogenase/NADH:ubiquinone oxidoreductase subunit G
MSKKVSLTIDGKKASVSEGTNLIDAADSVGVHIPNLCYMKGMRGVGACRLCLIEVEGGRGPVAGCITKVKDDMVVNTKTEDIQKTRKFIIDLILSMHPMDCMTCTKAGVCNLQQYAYDFEIKESSLTRKKMGYPVDEANPFIKRDPDYCVLCGRCVRTCQEQGTNVLEFMGRGVGAKVVTAMDKPLQESECTFCGSCVDACPVNALLEADRWKKGREWEYAKTDSTCLSCGSGCDITISTNDGNTVKINSNAADGSAEKYICALGRFGFESSSSDARVTTPMKRVNGKLEEISWQDAVNLAAEKLKSSQENTGIITTAGIPNQDAFVISRFASDVVKTKNIDSTASLYADADSMKYSDKVDLDASDVIIVAGLNPSQSNRILPAFDAGIKKRVARGAKLIVINSADTGLTSSSAVNITADEAASLAQLAKGLIAKGSKAPADLESAVSGQSVSEDMEKAAELLSGAKSPAIFCAPSLFGAARNLSLLLKVKVAAVPFEANARGVVTMGVTTEGKTYQEMSKGGVDVLYAIGEVPVSNKPDAKFIIAQTSYMTELAKEADLILPAATYIESARTITGYLGRDKEMKKAVDPAGSAKQHKDIVMDISKAAGTAIKTSASEMKSAHGVSEPVLSAFEKKQGLDTDPAALSDAINSAAYNYSRLLWFKEAKTAV